MIYLQEKYKWYDTTKANEFIGFYGFAHVKSTTNHWRAFESNHLKR